MTYNLYLHIIKSIKSHVILIHWLWNIAGGWCFSNLYWFLSSWQFKTPIPLVLEIPLVKWNFYQIYNNHLTLYLKRGVMFKFQNQRSSPSQGIIPEQISGKIRILWKYFWLNSTFFSNRFTCNELQKTRLFCNAWRWHCLKMWRKRRW